MINIRRRPVDKKKLQSPNKLEEKSTRQYSTFTATDEYS